MWIPDAMKAGMTIGEQIESSRHNDYIRYFLTSTKYITDDTFHILYPFCNTGILTSR